MFSINFKESKKSQSLEHFGRFLVRLSVVIFNVSVITFMVYLLLEDFKTGLISNYFDLNILLILAVCAGLIMLIFNHKIKQKKAKVGLYYLFLWIFVILVTLWLWLKLNNLGSFAYIWTALIAIAIFTIISLFINKE